MSKISFNRPNKDQYALKFNKNTGASDWPPQPEAEPFVENRLIDLILHEAKSIIKPQIDALGITLSSHQILLIVMHGIKADAAKSPVEHYNEISNNIFIQIEQKLPELIGQDDPSSWSFVVEV